MVSRNPQRQIQKEMPLPERQTERRELAHLQYRLWDRARSRTRHQGCSHGIM